MAEPVPQPPPGEPVSTFERVQGLAVVLLRSVSARGRLFQIEAQEAGSNITGIVVLAVMGLGFLAGAWLLLVPTAVWFAAQQTHQPWEYIAGGAGAAHLLLALIFLLRLRGRLRRLKLFEETLNQFERDRSWVADREKQPK